MKRECAVFLDKDGTLVENVPYNVDPKRIVLTQGVGTGLRRLQDAGFRLVVVSNQSGVARGYFAEEALQAVEERLAELLRNEGVTLSGFYYCPHHPQGSIVGYSFPCTCRKPAPGLIQTASHDLNIDLNGSWMIGDILDDIEAGRRAGCRTTLIDNGNETEWRLTPDRRPRLWASTVSEAAELIVSTLDAFGTRPLIFRARAGGVR